MKPAFIIALVGAESTGKTTLAVDLSTTLRDEGHDAVVVPEVLREFCERHGRTPRQDEQAGIAAEQTRRIELAASGHAVVIADTTAMMVAVYSDLVFGDTALYATAEAIHRRCSFTLLTALDLPWEADGHQRDGPHVREPVDRLVRASLQRSRAPYAVVSGSGETRRLSALAAVRRAMMPPPDSSAAPGNRWTWICERCGDVDCERHLLPRDTG